MSPGTGASTGMVFEDTYRVDTSQAEKNLNELDKAQKQVEKSQGGIRARFGELASGFADAAGDAEQFGTGLLDLGDGISGASEKFANFSQLIVNGGVTGALVGIGFAAVDVYKNFDKISEGLSSWLAGTKPVETQMESLSKKAKELSDQKAIINIDNSQILEAEERLGKLKANLDAVNTWVDDPREKETKQAASVRKAIADAGYAGKQGKENLLKEVLDSFEGKGATTDAEEARLQLEAARAEVEKQRKSVASNKSTFSNSPYGAWAIHGGEDRLKRLEKELEAKQQKFDELQKEQADNLLGGALRGESDSLAAIQGLAKKGRFNDTFAKGIEIADADSQSRIEETKRRQAEAQKEVEEQKKKDEEAKAKAEKAKADADAEKAKKAEKAKAEAEAAEAKKKADEQSKKQKEIDEASGRIGGGYGAQIDYELFQNRRNPELARKRIRALVDREHAVGGGNAEISDQIFEQATKRMRDAMTKYSGTMGQSQMAAAAYLQELTERLNRQQQEAQSTYQNIQNLRNQSRQYRPSLLPTF